MTPFEGVYNQAPDISHLRVWGCKTYLRTPRANQRKDFREKIYSGFLMGYGERGAMGYEIFVPELNDTVVGVNCMFNEIIPDYSEEYYQTINALKIEMVSDEKNIELYMHLVGERYIDNENQMMYVNTRVVLYDGMIVAYRALLKQDGSSGNEEKSPIHIADVIEMMGGLVYKGREDLVRLWEENEERARSGRVHDGILATTSGYENTAGTNRVQDNTAMSGSGKVAGTSRVRKNVATAGSGKSGTAIGRPAHEHTLQASKGIGKMRKGELSDTISAARRSHSDSSKVPGSSTKTSEHESGWLEQPHPQRQYGPTLRTEESGTPRNKRKLPLRGVRSHDSQASGSSAPSAAKLLNSDRESNNRRSRHDVASVIVPPETAVATKSSGEEEEIFVSHKWREKPSTKKAKRQGWTYEPVEEIPVPDIAPSKRNRTRQLTNVSSLGDVSRFAQVEESTETGDDETAPEKYADAAVDELWVQSMRSERKALRNRGC